MRTFPTLFPSRLHLRIVDMVIVCRIAAASVVRRAPLPLLAVSGDLERSGAAVLGRRVAPFSASNAPDLAP